MRIQAGDGTGPWLVWHVPTCTEVRYCVWVDDSTREYAVHDLAAWPRPCGTIPLRIERANRIEIHGDRRVVLIDPVEGDAPGETPADVIAELTA